MIILEKKYIYLNFFYNKYFSKKFIQPNIICTYYKYICKQINTSILFIHKNMCILKNQKKNVNIKISQKQHYLYINCTNKPPFIY